MGSTHRSSPTTIAELDDLITHPVAGVLETIGDLQGRIAVLGAGGKMGFHVSHMLQRGLGAIGRADRVITVSRFASPEKRELFTSSGFDVHMADLSDAEQVNQLPDADHVFFLAGIKFGTASQPELLQRMNVDMPRIVAQRYREAQIVALSTGCVYEFTTPESGGSTEQSPTNPPGQYAESCLGREQAFVQASREYGTPCSLIRLNYSNELRYGVLVDLAFQVMMGQPIALDTGHVNVIWQGDAVAHTIQALAHADSPPFILNVTGADVLSVRELAHGLGRRFQREPVFTGQEQETAWLNNAALSHQLFGPPQVSVEQMMDWIADWLKNDGPTLNKPTHFEVRDGGY